jgi:hypothetical protein
MGGFESGLGLVWGNAIGVVSLDLDLKDGMAAAMLRW